jgi:hypothetical protein
MRAVRPLPDPGQGTSMQLQFATPADAFLILRSLNLPDGTPLGQVGNFFQDLSRLVDLGRTYKIIDEHFGASGVWKAAAFKFLPDIYYAPMASAIQQLLLTKYSATVEVQFVAAFEPAEITLGADEYSVEHFRKEGVRDSQMIAHTENCVKLVHHATGTVARSTECRNKTLNFEEAIQLLAALVRNQSLLG